MSALLIFTGFGISVLLGYWWGRRDGQALFRQGLDLAERAEKELRHAAERLEAVAGKADR